MQVLDGLAGFGEVVDQSRAVGVRRDLLQFALAQRARDVAAHELPQRFEFQNCALMSSNACRVCRHFRLPISSAFPKGLFDHRQRALGDLQAGQIPPLHPFDARTRRLPAHSVPPVTRQR